MKKTKILIVLLVLAVFVSSCSEKAQTSAQQTAQKSSPEISSSQVPGKTYDVEIRSSGFRPENIEISKGDSIKWTNLDSVDHTITGPTFPMPTSTSPRTSGRLQPGESWTKQFDVEGYYGYSDMYKEDLKGKVIVK